MALDRIKPGQFPKSLILFWFLLGALAAYWAPERILYQDSAFGLFRLANGILPIEHGRWGMLPLVGPAWLAAKMNLSLTAVMAVLSATGVILLAISSFAIFKISQTNRLYLLPLFILIGTGAEWHFLGIAEMLPALCYASIAVAFLFSDQFHSYIKIGSGTFFAALAFFTHPGILPFLLFIPPLLWLKKEYRDAALFLVGLAMLTVLKKYLLPNSTYENEILTRAGFSAITGIFHSWSWGWVWGGFFVHFFLPMAFLILGLLIWNGKTGFWKKKLVFCAAWGILIIIVAIFPNGDSNLMMEKNFAPVVLAWFLPILLLEFNSGIPKTAFLFFLGFALLSSIWFHWQAGSFYHKRLALLDNTLQNQSAEKSFVWEGHFPAEVWRVTWALPYESLLRSASHNYGTLQLKTIKPWHERPDSAVLAEPNLFYGADFAYKINTDTLNSVYFPFQKNSRYQFVDSTPSKHP